MDATIRVAEVPASRGIAWIGESFKLFRAAPATWLAICAAWLVLSIGLMIVPIVGAVASNFLGLWLARRTPTELFYRITYLLMFLISLALIWQGASAIRAM